MNKFLFYSLAAILPILILLITKLTGSLIYGPALLFLVLTFIVLVKRSEGSLSAYFLTTIISSIIAGFITSLLPSNSDMEGLGLIIGVILLIILTGIAILVIKAFKKR